MNAPDTRKITEADFGRVTDLLVRAFDDDPWMNFVAKQDARRSSRMRAWLHRGFARQTFPHGETYMTAGCEGVALWTPPHPPSHAWMDDVELRVTLARVSGVHRVPQMLRAIRLIGQHEPKERHMELRLLAVEPALQGQGIASRLVRPMLQACDAQRLPTALLCTKESNVAVYAHFGFTVSAEVEIPSGPRLWEMWRRAS